MWKDQYTVDYFYISLINWVNSNMRIFPWRKPKIHPYNLLIAEVLLQRTYSGKVINVYEQFIERYSSPLCLANSNVDEIEDLINPLGLSKIKAKALKKIGEIITQDYSGTMPSNIADLKKMPLVGNYTANAVMCFAYGQRKAIVDGNVKRIFSRFWSLSTKESDCWLLAEKIVERVPECFIRQYNYSLLDFAASICIANEPRCLGCILINKCHYFTKLKAL